MKNVNWKAAVICVGTAIFTMACGYVAGHTSCAHRHVSMTEIGNMWTNDRGQRTNGHYIKEAFKDYIRMIKDPLGTKRAGLD